MGFKVPAETNTHLLRADGTIPIFYQGVKYNIPLKMFLPEGFPSQPPICYVQPTPNMIIKPGHTMVDGSGMVRYKPVPWFQLPREEREKLITEDMKAIKQAKKDKAAAVIANLAKQDKRSEFEESTKPVNKTQSQLNRGLVCQV